jgi:hypothetical protein
MRLQIANRVTVDLKAHASKVRPRTRAGVYRPHLRFFQNRDAFGGNSVRIWLPSHSRLFDGFHLLKCFKQGDQIDYLIGRALQSRAERVSGRGDLNTNSAPPQLQS